MSLPKASSSLVHVFKFMDWLREILLGKVSDSTVLSLWTEWQSARVTARLHQTMHTHSSDPTQSHSCGLLDPKVLRRPNQILGDY